jgi:hypothetical protein
MIYLKEGSREDMKNALKEGSREDMKNALKEEKSENITTSNSSTNENETMEENPIVFNSEQTNFLDTSISQIEISPRLRNNLKIVAHKYLNKNNDGEYMMIDIFNVVRKHGIKSLLSFRNFGKKTLVELDELFFKHKLHIHISDSEC